MLLEEHLDRSTKLRHKHSECFLPHTQTNPQCGFYRIVFEIKRQENAVASFLCFLCSHSLVVAMTRSTVNLTLVLWKFIHIIVYCCLQQTMHNYIWIASNWGCKMRVVRNVQCKMMPVFFCKLSCCNIFSRLHGSHQALCNTLHN